MVYHHKVPEREKKIIMEAIVVDNFSKLMKTTDARSSVNPKVKHRGNHTWRPPWQTVENQQQREKSLEQPEKM